MTTLVLDASVTLSWCFPDEGSDYADAILQGLEEYRVIVPSLWALEITNALLVGERSGRLRAADIRRFVNLVHGLAMLQETLPIEAVLNGVLPLAREHRLSAYDAAYLDLAIREGASLATLDNAMRKAARKEGVQLVSADG